MNIQSLVADAMAIVDEHAGTVMPDGAHLRLANALKGIHDESNQRDSRLVALLIKLLSAMLYSDNDVKAIAAAELENLARRADLRVHITARGGIQLLVELLAIGSDDAKARAALALAHLARDAGGRASIVSNDGVPPLVKLLRYGRGDEVKPMMGHAARALTNLAEDAAGRAAIKSAYGVSYLRTLLYCGSDDVVVQALRALGQMARDPDYHFHIVLMGFCGTALQAILELIRKSASDAVRTLSARVISKLAKNENMHVYVVDYCRAIPSLIDLLGEGLEPAGRALERFASNVTNKAAFEAAGVVRELEKLRTGGRGRIPKMYATAVLKLLEDDRRCGCGSCRKRYRSEA